MYYLINRETEKLELHFDKSEYQALSDAQKSSIKSNFLFSRYGGCWVSRAKTPNLWRAEQVAKQLGAENQGKTGEALTFEEKMERKADRAERRAERMDARSEKAAENAEQLQKPINDMHGDIAFFTQPNINTSAGRAFTNQRRKMFAAFERGMDEFKKSEYYAERAETARKTANSAKNPDKGFCERRIREAQANIRAQNRNIAHYQEYLEKMDSGETIKCYDGTDLTRAEVLEWIENAEERIEAEISKACYYQSCIDAQGGVPYSRENVKKGDLVDVRGYGKSVVISTGPKNITYRIMDGGAAGFCLKASYAEIKAHYPAAANE